VGGHQQGYAFWAPEPHLGILAIKSAFTGHSYPDGAFRAAIETPALLDDQQTGGRRARVRMPKNEYGLTPLRVRGRERVALHADLTMLARLSLALARPRAVPLAA